VKRALVVDRDPRVLRKVALELGRMGYSVETFDSTLGVTPDLFALEDPALVVIDTGLPGLDVPELVRGLPDVEVVLIDAALRPDWVMRGAQVLELAAGEFDALALIDDALDRRGAASNAFAVKLDLFSPHNVYRTAGGQRGIFIATTRMPEIGDIVAIEVDVLGYTFTAKGFVAWQRERSALGGPVPSGVGVELKGTTAADEAAIARFMEARAPIEHL